MPHLFLISSRLRFLFILVKQNVTSVCFKVLNFPAPIVLQRDLASLCLRLFDSFSHRSLSISDWICVHLLRLLLWWRFCTHFIIFLYFCFILRYHLDLVLILLVQIFCNKEAIILLFGSSFSSCDGRFGWVGSFFLDAFSVFPSAVRGVISRLIL